MRILRAERYGAQVNLDFAVVGQGWGKEQAILELESAGKVVSEYARVILSELFSPAIGYFRLGVILGSELPENERTNEGIRAEAAHRGWLEPTASQAVLLRQAVSDMEMRSLPGICALYVMHEPHITPATQKAPLQRHVLGLVEGEKLMACVLPPGHRFSAAMGFVFEIPYNLP